MGDKARAKDFARQQAVPVLAGQSLQGLAWPDIKHAAAKIGFPLVLKASYGGGGKGIRVLTNVHELHQQLRAARQEAAASFLNDAMYLEQFLTTARHIEVQVLGTGTKLFILGDRDCSLQLHKQKVLEESPASILTETQRRTLYDLSRQLLAGTHYQSLGTIEYLFADGQFYFMEMNTRLQVEHGVTELTTGIELWLNKSNRRLASRLIFQSMLACSPRTAIEVRLTATYRLQTRIERLSWAADAMSGYGLSSGDRLVTMYDGLIAVDGHRREPSASRAQLTTGLSASNIDGTHDELNFLQQTVARPAYIHDQYTIHSLARWEASNESLSSSGTWQAKPWCGRHVHQRQWGTYQQCPYCHYWQRLTTA